jgi:hypothetical protein
MYRKEIAEGNEMEKWEVHILQRGTHFNFDEFLKNNKKIKKIKEMNMKVVPKVEAKTMLDEY